MKIILTTLFLIMSMALTVSANNTEFVPQVSIPGSETSQGDSLYEIDFSTTSIAKYVRDVYNYGISIVGIVAAIALMLGGVMWLTAGGSAQKVGQAKDWIIGAITGITLALTSYLILQTINPNLVDLQITEVPNVQEVAASKDLICEETKGEKVFSINIIDDVIYDRETNEVITGTKCKSNEKCVKNPETDIFFCSDGGCCQAMVSAGGMDTAYWATIVYNKDDCETGSIQGSSLPWVTGYSGTVNVSFHQKRFTTIQANVQGMNKTACTDGANN